jgi:hypothetical protein
MQSNSSNVLISVFCVISLHNSGKYIKRRYRFCWTVHTFQFDDGHVLVSWDTTRVARWKSTDVSEEYIASIFRIQEWAKQETNTKRVTRKRTARRYIPEDRTRYNYRWENFSPHCSIDHKLEQIHWLKAYHRHTITSISLMILWHVDPLRRNDHELSGYTTAAARQRLRQQTRTQQFHGNNCIATKERRFLWGPCRDVISRTS